MPRLPYATRTALHQLLEMQRDICATALAEGTKPADKAQLARAWDTLEDRKRVLRGKPLPGSLAHEKVKRPSKQSRLAGGSAMLAEWPATPEQEQQQ